MARQSRPYHAWSVSERVYGSTVALAKESDPSAPLPTEFRIFAAGVNDSTKGPALFDADAARNVIETYKREGVDLMIDLNHESIDMPIRPDSGDARGWCQLELRNGELWAVNVRWTPDGARRLSEGTQKYISPVFTYDAKTGRVRSVLNVALVAMPATYNAQPLVAASRITISTAALARAKGILRKHGS
jgi:phage I-like protein